MLDLEWRVEKNHRTNKSQYWNGDEIIKSLLRVGSGLWLLERCLHRVACSDILYDSIILSYGRRCCGQLKILKPGILRDLAIETMSPFHMQENLMKLTGLKIKGFIFRCYFDPQGGFGWNLIMKCRLLSLRIFTRITRKLINAYYWICEGSDILYGWTVSSIKVYVTLSWWQGSNA